MISSFCSKLFYEIIRSDRHWYTDQSALLALTLWVQCGFSPNKACLCWLLFVLLIPFYSSISFFSILFQIYAILFFSHTHTLLHVIKNNSPDIRKCCSYNWENLPDRTQIEKVFLIGVVVNPLVGRSSGKTFKIHQVRETVFSGYVFTDLLRSSSRYTNFDWFANWWRRLLFFIVAAYGYCCFNGWMFCLICSCDKVAGTSNASLFHI